MSLNTLSKKLKDTEHFFENVYHSMLGFLKIIFLSKFNISMPPAKQESCIILGNGPSLKESFQKNENAIFKNTPLLCVNNFAASEQFFQYKPSYYVLLDPGFFIHKQREDVAATMNILKGKVDWEITLFVPYIHRKDADVQFFIKKNSFVKVQFFNYTVFKGFQSIAFKLFEKNLAMPQFSNVLGAAIFLMINMGYKKVWLMGADHSWFKNIYVSDDNSMYIEDKHFYDTEKQKPINIKDPLSGKKAKAEELFLALYKTFNSYYLLEEYSKYKRCIIYNASEYSYIDAFERKKIEL